MADSKANRKLVNATEINSDSALVKAVPDVFDRFVEVYDQSTQEACNALMCKTCRLLIKKNVLLVSSHLCKNRDVERHVSLPVTGKLMFRAKPKNRATPIWDEFEEVFEPTSGTLLGYARCKRCMDIIKTSDPKSIPAVLRRHLPLCPCGPFPPSLMITPLKSESMPGETLGNLWSVTAAAGSSSVSSVSSSKMTKHGDSSELSGCESIGTSSTANHTDRKRSRDQLIATPPIGVHPRLPTEQQIMSRLLAAQNQMNSSNSITIVPISGGSGANSPAPPNGSAVESQSAQQLIQQVVPYLTKATQHHSSSATSSSASSPSIHDLLPASRSVGHNGFNGNHGAAKALALAAAAAAAAASGVTTNGVGNNSNSKNASTVLQLKSEFRKRCIDFCCTELISLETIASDSFRRLGQSLMCLGAQSSKPQTWPDTSQLYTQLHAQCSAAKAQLKAELQNEITRGAGAALVCDSHDEVCVLSAMYVNANWQLNEAVLAATSTCCDINSFISSVLDEYELTESDRLNKVTFVSRGGLFDGVNISLNSIAHSLDQIVESSIFFDDTYTELIDNCRIICAELGVDIKTEESVESVEWIIKFELMRQVLANQDKFELNNSSFNLHLLRFMVDLLGPFKNASIELRLCSSRPTLCQILLWYYKIMKALQLEPPTDDPQLDDTDRKYMQQMRRTLRENVEANFQLHTLHKVAVFLWPNFRTLKMIPSAERNQVHAEVRSLIETRFPDLPTSASTSKCDAGVVKKARTDFADWEEESGDLGQQDEIERYVNAPLSACNESNLLGWWRDHQTEYPQLAQLAKWLFAIPASVTMLERFKLNGSPKVDDELLFLHCNLYS